MARPQVKSVAPSQFGEAPHWDEKRQELIYVDYLAQSILRYVPDTHQQFEVDLGFFPSVVVPVEGRAGKYVVADQKDMHLMLLDWNGVSSKPDHLNKIVSASVKERENKYVFNDGKCDNQGRFWIGTCGGLKDDGTINTDNLGKLCSLDADEKSFTGHVDGIGHTNGMAWSSDSSKFYYVDSWKNRVDVFDFDAQCGTLSNQRVLYDYKKNGSQGMADGVAIDAQNNIWVASYMGANVLHIDSTTGRLIEEIDFRAHTNKVTSLAFGGKNMDTLYVTSTTLALPGLVNEVVQSEEKNAGCLLEVTNIQAKGPQGGGVNYKGPLSRGS